MIHQVEESTNLRKSIVERLVLLEMRSKFHWPHGWSFLYSWWGGCPTSFEVRPTI